jgi:hypothetical protein
MLPCYHSQFDNLVSLHAMPRRPRTYPADRNRAADRQAKIVGKHRGREPLRQCRFENASPRGSRFDHDAIRLDPADGTDRVHINHDAIFSQGAPINRMALPTRCNL